MLLNLTAFFLATAFSSVLEAQGVEEAWVAATKGGLGVSFQKLSASETIFFQSASRLVRVEEL